MKICQLEAELLHVDGGRGG